MAKSWSKRAIQAKSFVSHEILFLLAKLGEQLNPCQPLKQLADTLPWSEFEQAFGKYHSRDGRTARRVRLMVGVLLLKHLFNDCEEKVVVAPGWSPYWQYFAAMSEFHWRLPCDPGDQVYFSERIGRAGMQRILKVTAQPHGDKAQGAEVIVDATVQERNITHPTGTKLAHKLTRRCWKLADAQGVKLHRRDRKAVRHCVMAQRWRKRAPSPIAAPLGHRGSRVSRTQGNGRNGSALARQTRDGTKQMNWCGTAGTVPAAGSDSAGDQPPETVVSAGAIPIIMATTIRRRAPPR